MALIPFDDRDGESDEWRDGGLAGRTHSYINPRLHYGSQVFEGERAYGGTILITRAYAKASLICHYLDWTCLCLMRRWTHQGSVLANNNIVDGYVRAFCCGSEMAISAQETKIHLAVAAGSGPAILTLRSR